MLRNRKAVRRTAAHKAADKQPDAHRAQLQPPREKWSSRFDEARIAPAGMCRNRAHVGRGGEFMIAAVEKMHHPSREVQV